MKLFLFAFLPFVLYLIPICHTCQTRNDPSGVIELAVATTASTCWKIEVPENTYLQINITQLKTWSGYCSTSYLEITPTESGRYYCSDTDSYRKPITAFSDVTITFYDGYYTSPHTSFSLNYHIVDPICAEEHHFRCSSHRCVNETQVCDGVEDCDNGLDEICGPFSVKGLNASRENAIAWLLRNEQTVGWGKNTHRAITALYLAQNASFHGQHLEEELMAKKLELQTAVALLRNSTDSLSVSDLSMFVNALSATCHNPRQFYGYDLVKALAERVSLATSPSPGAYLTLCNSDWTLSESDIHRLLHLLQKRSRYPFALDVQALTVMALTCVKNLQGKGFTSMPTTSDVYNAKIKEIVTGQLSDGSFGNVYTTALVTQALIASGQENNTEWNVTSTIQYLMHQLNSSSVDFLSTSLALPIFSGKSLVDLADINCTNISRKQDEDSYISNLTTKLGRRILVQYSLFVEGQKDSIITIYLRLPEQSSAYDVMRVAQVADPKYKFRHRDVSGHIYIYEIAGIVNDPEAGKFWLMYSQDGNGTIGHFTESPDKLRVQENDHMIMWYKTAHI